MPSPCRSLSAQLLEELINQFGVPAAAALAGALQGALQQGQAAAAAAAAGVAVPGLGGEWWVPTEGALYLLGYVDGLVDAAEVGLGFRV